MKKFKKIILALSVIVFLLLSISYFYVYRLNNKGLPDYNKNIKLEGMQEEVTIYRDNHGIPHIYAKNQNDLYIATGYIMAQDRLWQMDLLRRATMGRLSEIFGKDLINVDYLMRSLQITEKSKMVVSETDEKILMVLKSFAKGVNQYIENNKDKLPVEFSILGYEPEKWEIEHSINLVGYMAWDLSLSWNSEITVHELINKFGENKVKEILPNIPNQKTAVYPNFKFDTTEVEIKTNLVSQTEKLEELGLIIFNGSNNWAVSGKKSVTGKPILANDMHLGLSSPGIWYQMHQVIEGEMNVTGVALPGQPAVVAGHNDNIAWGMTNVMVDNMDFYIETINPDNPNQYKFNGTWKDMIVKKEKIKTKDGQIVEKEIKFTHRGPIISNIKKLENISVSMKWMGNEYSNELRSLYLLNRAKNWEEFKNAVKTFKSVSQNIVYSDIEGNIGLYSCVGIPKRKGNAITLLPGDTDEYDWKGTVPFDSLPHSYNPECGYVSSANNKTAPDDYPYYISNWYILPYRIDRIREMLNSKEKLSIDDYKEMLKDHKSKLVERILPTVLAEMKKIKDLNAIEKESLSILENWDGILSKESVAASIFEQFYSVLLEDLLKDEMKPKLYNKFISNGIMVRNAIKNIVLNPKSEWCDDVNTDKKEQFYDIVEKSFKKTVSILKNKISNKPNDWNWGKIHTLTLEHPLGKVKMLDFLFGFNKGPYAVGGSNHTVSPYAYKYKNLFDVMHGASHRHIYSLENWDNSLSIIPTGVSGMPASDYYCDQTKMYINNEYHNDFVSKELIIKNAKYKMVIN